MKKIVVTALLLAGSLCPVMAQTIDAPTAPKEKKFDHLVGVQVNGLIRQVFNFNNSTGATNNPYLLTYNINSIKSGYGLRLGFGYDYNSSGDNDGVNIRKSKLDDMHLRLGLERKFKLTGNWSAGAGADFVYSKNNDNTDATTISFDTVNIKTTTIQTSYGGGVMAWLRYSINKNIVVGTESSFYYTTGKQEINVTVKRTNPQVVVAPTTTVTDNKISKGTMSLPVVFYLSVKF